MPAVFLYSDPHFSHLGVCKFMGPDGFTKLRPWDNPEEMDDELVRRFNERVGVKDKVYFLGDVAINRRGLKVLERLNCKDLVLIRGNHDIFRDDEYRRYFRELRAYHVLNGMILSHIPLHSDSLGRFGVNIHGHLHAHRVKRAVGFDAESGTIIYSDEIDPRYHCVCVEHTDFAPVLLEDVVKRIEAEGGEVGFRNGNGPAM